MYISIHLSSVKFSFAETRVHGRYIIQNARALISTRFFLTAAVINSRGTCRTCGGAGVFAFHTRIHTPAVFIRVRELCRISGGGGKELRGTKRHAWEEGEKQPPGGVFNLNFTPPLPPSRSFTRVVTGRITIHCARIARRGTYTQCNGSARWCCCLYMRALRWRVWEWCSARGGGGSSQKPGDNDGGVPRAVVVYGVVERPAEKRRETA